MSKKIYIGENDLIKIKRFMAGKKTGHKPFIAENEPPYEKDEFEIGGEGGNNDYFHINENANKKPKNIITESQESKSIAAAKKLVMQRLNYNEQEADEFIRIKLRNDIPSLRTPQGGKFILGVTRMFCDGELRSANDIGNLNSTLKLVASDAHINEYDRNLNGLSAQELIQRFAKAMSDNLEAEKAEIAQMVFDTPSDYEIVRIDSFEQAEEYGQYVSWCVAHNENMFNSYTSDGINQFYFCLKNGFENVEETPSEGCPLDEYGLSMIAVSVNENGMLNTCTCRWNHDNGGNDSIMNAKQVSQVIGMNFFEVFKPNDKWKDLITSAMQRLENGEDSRNVFDEVGDFSEGFARVELNDRYNFINQEGKFLSDQWFEDASDFSEGFAAVKLNGIVYKLDTSGRIFNTENVGKDSNKLVINEYNADLRLPFEEPEYANKFYIEQYKDWLEDYGRYGKLPNGTLNFWDEIRKAVTKIKDEQLHGRFDKSIPQDMSVDEVINDLQTNLIGPYIKFTNDGKVYVERDISINKRPRGYDNDQRTDFYKQLWKDYNDNVGGCWSYRKDGAQAYCGDDYGYSIILRGYIRTDDIDFIKTVQLNYHYSNEHEIRVKPFAKVELFNFSYGNDTINFDKGLIVSSTYSGNNSKFVGNVGKIDDGFGNITYINRQNKILNGEEEYNNELNKYVDERLSKGEDIYDVFDYVGAFRNGFAIVELLKRHNFFNEANGLISEKWYDDCNDFENGFARVKLGDKWAFIREDGERINNEWYDDCYNFENGFAKVKLGEKYAFIREDGERINNEWYDYCYDFHNGFVIVKIDNKKTFIRQDGKRINNELYDGCDDFKNGFAKVKLGEKWTFIREDGSHVNNEWYDGCNIFKNGFAIVKLGDECTFIREDGQHINNEWYDYCSDFINGFARVNLGEKWTFIREDGQHINNEWYDWCYNFENGFARVKLGDKWYKIDTSGRRFNTESVNNNSKKLIMNENQLIALKENIETEVESNEVNLSSFKKNDSLAKRIWDGMDLNPRVRLKLLDIADDFWDFTDINWVKPKGIHLTGSICNFNWSDESDIDLHLVVDFSEVDDRKDFVQEYFNSKKNEWNEEHSNLKIFGYPVELYVEDVNAETVSSGIYDLEENKWISEPSKDEIEEIGLDKYEIKSLAAKLMTKIDGLYDEFSTTDDDAKLRSIGKRADKLLSSIKQMRKDGLSRGGESDPFNVVYKVLRRTDYLENLFNLKSELYDKLNSIDIEESVIEYYYNKIYPLNEEVVADGSAEHNPFKKRWKYEREALKSYLCNNGELMTSKENGKQYKVIFDTMLSQRLGLNYCICIQWNPITMKPGNIIYVRAYDKFTKKIFTPQFDTRGYDNVYGTSDDLNVY